MTAGDVTNPASGSESLVTLSTSSDPTPQSDPTALGSFGASGHVSTPIFTTTTTAAGATNVTWGVTFATSATGALVPNYTNYGYDAIVITSLANSLPHGNTSYYVTDLTTGNAEAAPTVNVTTSGGHDTATITLRATTGRIAAGDLLHVSVFGATNPPSGDFSSVGVSTTSDIPVETIGSPRRSPRPPR